MVKRKRSPKPKNKTTLKRGPGSRLSKAGTRKTARPKAKAAKPKGVGVFDLKAYTAEWVTDPECPECVRSAVKVWSGQDVYDFSQTLRDVYAPKGACGNPALEDLRQILGVRCHRTPSLSAL